ncbi:MAG: extracellular solute-binding protein [Chloroflexi bacterium]|nr:extracellular solute-binding protein [Chloroflexota bacterium]
MKRMMYGLLLVCLLSVAVACAQAGPTAGTPPPKASPAAAAVSGWQKKWDDTLAAAKKEGVVVFYAEVTPGMRDAVAAGLENRFGVRVEFVAGRATELAPRWERERAGGINQADVFLIGGGTGILTMKPQGAFQPIEPHLMLPEVTDPNAWEGGKIRFIDSDRMMIPMTSSFTTYTGINTDLIKEGQLQSYRDLLKPEWKGKLILMDPSVAGAAAGWGTFMITDAFGMEGGKDYMRQMAATEPPISKDVRQAVEWVSRGRYAIGVGVQHALTVEFKQMGAPITIQRFVEGGNINPGASVLEMAARPQHPNAAAVFVNWLLTKEGQIAMNKPAGNPPIRKDLVIEGIDPTKIARPGEKAFLTDENFFKVQGQALAIAREIFGALLK